MKFFEWVFPHIYLMINIKVNYNWRLIYYFVISPGMHEGQQSPGIVFAKNPTLHNGCGHNPGLQFFGGSVVNQNYY